MIDERKFFLAERNVNTSAGLLPIGFFLAPMEGYTTDPAKAYWYDRYDQHAQSFLPGDETIWPVYTLEEAYVLVMMKEVEEG